jgi:ectoine hydroxylase-related dioxygenase (phytanoyl-CoA dioxygenase family)
VNGTVGLDGRPTLLTVWIPYTDATPENGCIYALPTSLDPNLPNHQEIRMVPHAQYVTALPADAGSIVAWNQFILHWGGRCSPYAPHPRISTGIYFQSSAEPDYRRAVPFDAPLPFETRLTLIANAFRRYHETFGFPPLLLEFIARHADT